MKKKMMILMILILCAAGIQGCKTDESKSSVKTEDIKEKKVKKTPGREKEDPEVVFKRAADAVSEIIEKNKKEDQKLKTDGEEVETIEGITVLFSLIRKPEEGRMVYIPYDASGYFTVDGAVKAETSVEVGSDPKGILYYDLFLELSKEMEFDAKIKVLKDGKVLEEYSQKNFPLPSGKTTVTACIKTNEDAVCSGEYKIRFYVNDRLLAETTENI